MNVEFDGDELQLLRKVLAEYITNLREEAHHTDAHDYKEQLRQEEALLQRIENKVKAP